MSEALSTQRAQEGVAQSVDHGSLGRPSLLQSVQPVLGLIAEKAGEGRANRQVTDEVVAAIKSTGMMRAFLPAQWGGLEATPQEFFEAAIAIAERDMSTAWITGIIAVHAYQLAIMNEDALRDVYQDDPDTCVSSSYNPVGGKVALANGGLMLSGRWGWSSGSHHCTWALLGGIVPGEGYRTFLVPRSDYRIEDTWFVMGLQGTGSNDIVIDEPVFVPDYRTHKRLDGFNCVHGQKNPVYGIPWAQIFARIVSTPAIGAVRAAVNVFAENAATSSTDPTKLQGDPDITQRVAQSLNDADEVEAILYRNFDRLVAAVRAGEEIPMADRVRYRYQAGAVIDRMITAVDRLFHVGGGRTVFEGAALQNIWHDIHIARAHVANNPVPFGRNWGGMVLGAENTDEFV